MMKIIRPSALIPIATFALLLYATSAKAQIQINATTSPATCIGCNGNIFTTTSGGTAPFTYQWSPNVSNAPTIHNLCPGNYCVTITDANGTTATTCATVTSYYGSNMNLVVCANNPSCYGQSSGSATLTVAGGIPPYTYHWTGPGGFTSTVQNLNNVPAGTYTVIVTESSTGCIEVATVTLANPSQIVALSNITHASAAGSDGAIALTVAGGNPPYAYHWSSGSTTPSIGGLFPGTYSVTITDSKGCTVTHTAVVEQNIGGGIPPITVSGYVTNAGCNQNCNGTITVDANGASGSSNFLYTWSTGSATKNLTNLCPGNYCVTVFDISNGMTTTECFIVGQGQSQFLEIQSTNAAFCNYAPNGSLPVCEKVCPTTTTTYFVTPPTDCGMPLSLLSAVWTVSGAESYTVSPDKTEVTVVWGASGAGLVKMEAFNAQQGLCFQSSRCITIVEEPEAKFSSDPPAAANAPLEICKGQTVKFKNQSLHYDALEWHFSDNLSTRTEENPQHTFLNAGTYTVTLIARSNCLCADTTTLLVEVLDTEPPLLDCVGSVCPGESITYTTSNQCASYTWSVSPNGTVQSGGGDSDNSITVQWDTGAQGSISLSVTSCAGASCPQASVFVIPIISDDAEIKGPEVVCSGNEEEYSIEPFDGTDFKWTLASGGSIIRGQGTNKVTVVWTGTPNPDGLHHLSVKYENCYLGCGGADNIPVRILSPFVITGPVEMCDGATKNFSTLLTAYSGSVLCNWSIVAPDGTTVWASTGATNNINFTPAHGIGTYRIFAVPTFNNTCSTSAEWRVKVVANPPKPASIVGPTSICPGTPYTYTLLGNSPYLLEWNINNGTPAPTKQLGNNANVTWGNINPRWLSLAQLSTDGLGCISDTLMLNVQALPAPTVTGTPEVCIGTVGSYSTFFHQNLDYQWEIVPANAGTIKSGQGKNTIEIFWQMQGVHTVRLTRCGGSANFMVLVHPDPVPAPTYPPGLCPNEFGTAAAGASYSSYIWKNEADNVIGNTPTVQVSPGTYTLAVTDAYGCKGTSEFTVNQYPKPNVTVTTADPTGFCDNSLYVSITALTTNNGTFSYEWFRDGNPVGANTPVHVTNQYGYYSATVTNEYGCKASDGTVRVFEYCGGVCHNPSHGPKCAPEDVDFKIAPSARCDSFQFSLVNATGLYLNGSAKWHFGESGSNQLGIAYGENPSFVFPNGGKYIVVLYAQLTNGATCIVLDSVNVEAVAQFSQTMACPGDSTYFKDESTRLPETSLQSWHWEFGESGAATGNVPTPTHAYSHAGNYTATLTITTTSGCTSTYSENVFVPNLPAPTFAPPVTNCASNAAEFKAAPDNSIVSVEWDFGDPPSGNLNTSKAALAYHSYNPAGIYSVGLTATNNYGCKASFSQPITIIPNPFSGNITPGGVSTICEGKTIGLNAPAASGASYSWSNGANTPSITVGAEGIYGVTLTNANGCSYSPPKKTVEVNPAPVGVIKALQLNEFGQVVDVTYSTLEVCAGQPVNLEIQSNGNFNYLWNGGNGNSAIITFSEDRGNALIVGNYTYTVTVTNPSTGCTTITTPFDVKVNPLPSGFSLTTDDVCAGTPSTLTYLGTQLPQWEIFWNTGVTGQSTLTTDQAGLYFVRVMNEHGCVAQSNTVVIFPGPNIAALPAGCHARCNPDTLCIPSLPDIVSWQWYFDGAPIPGATSSDLVATQSGTYWADLVDVNGCKAQSEPLTLALYQGSGDILGKVWSDVNDNGIIDAGDTLVSGIPILLLQNNAPVANSQSGATGNFDFLHILSTEYVVQIDSLLLDPIWNIIIGENIVELVGCAQKGFVDLLVSALKCTPSTSALTVETCPGTTYHFAGVDLAAGQTQMFTLTNSAGCDSLVTVTVEALPTSASNLEVKTCPGTTYNFAGVDLAAGQTQVFTLTNSAGCDSLVTVTVEALPTSASNLEVKTCPGTTYNFAGVDLAVGQTQVFTLTNSVGCDSLVTIAVTAWPVLDFDVEALPSCPTSPTGSLAISVGGGAPATFSLDGATFQASTRFDALAAGAYTVFARDANGCVFEQEATLEATPRLELSLPATIAIPCDSNAVTIAPAVSGDTTGLRFAWSSGAATPAALVAEAGPLWVEASNHCQTVRREATAIWASLSDGQDVVYAPNVFAPESASDDNRTFRVFFARNVEVLEYSLLIFDRWGNLMFVADAPEQGWTGVFRQKTMEPGVYVWHLRARLSVCGRSFTIQRTGDVAVVR
ncbi:MAG: PKD domain-containing protein [Saprospiraceae bacterium]|nr:PKD domain-containing protein [Saprospiraceae bacterium]